MSASSNVIWRGLRHVLQMLGVAARVEANAPESASTVIVSDNGPSIADPSPTSVPMPAVASLLAGTEPRERRPELPRPLASQLAYTAKCNVPKGRKPKPSPAAIRSGQGKVVAIKAKPVVVKSVKKAPKRRHVWLCNQSRVIRPISANVVPLTAGRVRHTHKQNQKTIQKTARALKLAA